MRLFLLMREDNFEKTVAQRYVIMQGRFKYKGEKYILFFSDYCKQNDANIADVVWTKDLNRVKNRFTGEYPLPEKLMSKIVEIAPSLK